jgi:hypothetical protein
MFSREVEVMVSIPLTESMASSIGTVTSDSTSCGAAPGKIVVILTIGILISGFKRCGKLK